jgi:hypothetical protein
LTNESSGTQLGDLAEERERETGTEVGCSFWKGKDESESYYLPSQTVDGDTMAMK